MTAYVNEMPLEPPLGQLFTYVMIVLALGLVLTLLTVWNEHLKE